MKKKKFDVSRDKKTSSDFFFFSVVNILNCFLYRYVENRIETLNNIS